MGLFFEEGGMVMWPTAFFGLLLVASAVLKLRSESPRSRRSLLLGMLTLASGALGTALGLGNTMRWVTRAPEAERWVGGAIGIAESLNNLVLALLLVGVALLVCAAGSFRGGVSRGR